MILSSILSAFLVWYMSTQRKHLYCAYKQSAGIKEIAGKDFTFSLNVRKTNIPVDNFYTTKISIVNAGFGPIKNDSPDKNPLIIEFPENSRVIGYRKKRGVEHDGFVPEIDNKNQNIFKVGFKGFNKGEKVYFEIFCINGEKERPILHTPYKPIKIDMMEAYEEVEASSEKNIWKFFSVISILALLLFIHSMVKSRYLYYDLGDYVFATFSLMLFLILFLVSVWMIRKINLLIFPSFKKEELESEKVEDRILHVY